MLKSNPSSQHSKVLLYRWGVRRRREKKSQKSRSEEKMVGFSSAPYFLQESERQSPRVESKRLDHQQMVSLIMQEDIWPHLLNGIYQDPVTLCRMKCFLFFYLFLFFYFYFCCVLFAACVCIFDIHFEN